MGRGQSLGQEEIGKTLLCARRKDTFHATQGPESVKLSTRFGKNRKRGGAGHSIDETQP